MSSPPVPVRRIHVVTLIDHLAAGGAERVALDIATRLDPHRFRSTLCVSRTATRQTPAIQAALAELGESGTGLLALGRRRKVDVWVWARLWRYLRREQVDVLHAHKFGSNVWAAVVGRAARVPVVIAHEHTWSYEGRPVRRFLDREIVARGSDAFVAVSREDRRRMTSVERIPPERTVYIPAGTGAASRRATGSDVRAELGIDSAAPVVGAVGFLRKQKAYPVLIDASAILRDRYPDLRVLIVGDGEERDKLGALIRQRGLDDAVTLLGRRLDVPDVLAAMDVAVCSSDFEGSPRAVMEYMEAGLPVVATRVGGVPDLIDDQVHGLLVPRRDPSALAGAVGRLLSDPGLGDRLGAAGQRRRLEDEQFDVEASVRRIEALYEDRLEARGALPA